jgi:hypothetical protein
LCKLPGLPGKLGIRWSFIALLLLNRAWRSAFVESLLDEGVDMAKSVLYFETQIGMNIFWVKEEKVVFSLPGKLNLVTFKEKFVRERNVGFSL